MIVKIWFNHVLYHKNLNRKDWNSSFWHWMNCFVSELPLFITIIYYRFLDEALAESSKATQAPGLEASGVRAKFSSKSLPNQLLSALNFYRWGPKKGLTKDAYSWGGVSANFEL